MNAIKLPVNAVQYATHSEVVDLEKRLLCSLLWHEQAQQIATALNNYDQLVDALKLYDSGCVGCDIARDALANLEDKP